MGDEYTESVDTSSDVDVSDVADDIPEDIPDDIPEDVPEDVPEDDYSDTEDIAEDIPEDVPEDISEDDYSDAEDVAEDIPEDIPEDDYSDTEDVAEDIPEDIPEDVPEDNYSDVEDAVEDIPEDVITDETADVTGDSVAEETSDQTENTATDEVTDTQEDAVEDAGTEVTSDLTEDTTTDEATDTQEDTGEDSGAEETSDLTEDTATDEVTNTQEDTGEDSGAEETSDLTEDTTTAETIDTQEDTGEDSGAEETSDLTEDTATDEVTDTQDDAVEDSGAEETSDLTEDTTADEVTDTQEDTGEDSGAEETSDLTEDTATDEITDTQEDAVEDVGTEEISDLTEDTATDEVTDTQEDAVENAGTEVTSDLTEDTATDEVADTQEDAIEDAGTEVTSNLAEDTTTDEATDTQEDAVEDDGVETYHAVPGRHGDIPVEVPPYKATPNTQRGPDQVPHTEETEAPYTYHFSGYETHERPEVENPKVLRKDNEDFSDGISEEQLTDNGSDVVESSQDAIENKTLGDLTDDTSEKTAMTRMSEYMNSHNYGLDDKATYMSDPEWISINRDLKAELGIPQTAQEQMADYMGSHNYGIWDRNEYMKDPEWQSLNEALQNEIANKGIPSTPTYTDSNEISSPEEKGRISTFFSSIFGTSTPSDPATVSAMEPTYQGFEVGDALEANEDIATTSQILQQPSDVDESKDFVSAIEKMDYNDLSDKDKELMYNTAKEHIGETYGDLVSEDRINEIPKHIKIADTEECRKAYEASGGKYGDNTVGFYCPRTDEIFVDAPRNGDMTEIMATVEHESLHLASNGGVTEYLFDTSSGRPSWDLSTNVNEGITEMYAMRDMADMGFDYKSTSYQREVGVVQALEEAMGKDVIRNAYFNHQPELIRTNFDNAFTSDVESGSGKYNEFLNDFNRYIRTSSYDPEFATRKATVYDWISNLKAKRRNV